MLTPDFLNLIWTGGACFPGRPCARRHRPDQPSAFALSARHHATYHALPQLCFPSPQLYTSGSTGKPKGVLHTTAGYMIGAASTFKYVFDYKPDDIYWCTADCGWITGEQGFLSLLSQHGLQGLAGCEAHALAWGL